VPLSYFIGCSTETITARTIPLVVHLNKIPGAFFQIAIMAVTTRVASATAAVGLLPLCPYICTTRTSRTKVVVCVGKQEVIRLVKPSYG